MDRDLGKGLITHYHPMLIDLKNSEIPIITAINGVAAGSGFQLALLTDIRVSHKNAKYFSTTGNI